MFKKNSPSADARVSGKVSSACSYRKKSKKAVLIVKKQANKPLEINLNSVSDTDEESVP